MHRDISMLPPRVPFREGSSTQRARQRVAFGQRSNACCPRSRKGPSTSSLCMHLSITKHLTLSVHLTSISICHTSVGWTAEHFPGSSLRDPGRATSTTGASPTTAPAALSSVVASAQVRVSAEISIREPARRPQRGALESMEL